MKRTTSRLWVLEGSTALVAVMTASSALAQTASPDAAKPVPQAETQQDASPSTTGDIIVTASRRATDVTAIPYNITAVGGDALARTNTTNLAQIANQVPGFTLEDRGARFAGSQVPIIRGLNASNQDRTFLVQEQSPVATYIGNSPVYTYVPLDDVQRVEVLRGPQGTLYGAGSLGGTVRIIPNDPERGRFSLKADAAGSLIAHSGDHGYSFGGTVNIPLGEIAALRVSGRLQYEPGFVDQAGIVQKTGDPVTSPAVLATPGDIANSRAVYVSQKDANWARTRSVRGSLLIEPSSNFKAIASFSWSRITGNGGPVTNPSWQGGAYAVDPRVNLPASGDYQLVASTLEPFERETKLATLDLSYDMGFATVSTTSSYFDTDGKTAEDITPRLFAIPAAIAAYYIGNPIDPRVTVSFEDTDRNKTFSQEIRLVSKSGGRFDYTIGGWYMHQKTTLGQDIYEPGITEQTIASGGLLVPTFANGLIFTQRSSQVFTDKSIFGEATFHITPKWDITGGFRAFWQNYTQDQSYNSAPFGGGAGSSRSPVSDQIFKVNTTYEFMPSNRVYATFSQGFRRGGASAFPLTGPLREPAQLATYAPDKVNNYEVGIKGRLPGGFRYTFDLFWDDWKNVQIAATTPNGWAVVVNAPSARSRGIEAEISTPLFIRDLTLVAGYSYADAKLLAGFCAPVGNGGNACGISAPGNTRLPGSPMHSGSATLTYNQHLNSDSGLTYSLNATYKGSIKSAYPNANQIQRTYSPYTLVNASITYNLKRYSLGLYATNLLDERAILGQNTFIGRNGIGNLIDKQTINRPREVGIKASYAF